MAAFVLACALSFTRAHEAYAQAPAAAPANKGGEYAAVVAQLRSPDIAARGAASAQLLKAGPAALPDILSRIAEARMRVPLLRLISDMGPKGVQELVRLTDDPVLAMPAADALSFVVRQDSAGEIPGLAACMVAHPDLVDMCGRGLVAASGPRAAAQFKILLGLVRRPEPGPRLYALLAMARIGPGASAGVPEALRSLADPNVPVRVAAARALGASRRSTPQVRDALKAAAADPVREVAAAAEEALKALPKPRAGKPATKGAPNGGRGKAR